MSGSAASLAFDPFIPWWAIATFGGIALVLLLLSLRARPRRRWWRALVLASVLAALPQPILVEEESHRVQVAPDSVPRPPEPWEAGWKDTVTAYPGEVTRVKMKFENAGQYVWHCHIVSHEDNEMMRPYRIGPEQEGQPGSD